MSKKIIIVTVYNSENCGSFLQAYAMQKVLNKLQFDVAFYKRDIKGTSHEFSGRLLSLFKRVLLLKFNELKFIYKPWFSFEKAIKEFRICCKNSEFYHDAEIVLLGSDTIWNFDSAYFRNKSDVFLGKIFDNKKVVSYAASAANTSPEVFHDIVLKNGGLDNLYKVLVRDMHTNQLVENEGCKSFGIVTDPTLLLHKDDYLELISDESIPYQYVLLYYFGELEEELKKSIQSYADKNNLKIVSLLKHRHWCDYSITADPKKMILYFSKAEAVITNTFHGCAFSMIFEKPYAVHNEEKRKVNDLLSKYKDNKRLFTEPDAIYELLELPCDVIYNGQYDLIKNQSWDLLCEVLDID